MNGDWLEVQLGEVATLQRGFDLPQQNRKNGTVPIISSSGKTDTHNESRVSAPGVVTGRYGTIGQVFFIEEDFFPLNTTLWVKDFHGNDPHFVYYLLLTLDFQQFNDKSSVPGINRNHVHLHKVLRPPLEIQQKIASILGVLDDKIELNRRTNATLETIAQTLFKSWFVDFDPVKAKAAGLEPEGLDAKTAALFPSGFGEDGLPQGWGFQPFGNVADINWGDTNTTKSSYVTNGFLAFSATGPDGFLPSYNFDRPGVVVSAIGANAGNTWFVNGKWSCIKNTIRFWSTQPEISTEYLYFATLGKEKWPLRGSAQPFISQGDARNMKVLIPQNKLGEIFGDLFSVLNSRMIANNLESQHLAITRDSLLPKLLSGELDVTDFDLQKEGVQF